MTERSPDHRDALPFTLLDWFSLGSGVLVGGWRQELAPVAPGSPFRGSFQRSYCVWAPRNDYMPTTWWS